MTHRLHRWLDEPAPPDSPTVWEISRFLAQTQALVEGHWDRVLLRGEIRQLSAATSGHGYLTLVDASGQPGSLACVVWRGQFGRLRSILREGEEVVVMGRPTLYPPTGRFQFVIEQAEPAGEGQRRLALEALRRKLIVEGLIDPHRRRPLPPLPRIVGLVVSGSGAVLHDMLQVAAERLPVLFLHAEAPAQGAEAVAGNIAALRALIADGRAEAIVIARGGGSKEDLAAYDEEPLLRAVAACPIPTVSAIGHEVDSPLLDEVADARAPTPSAAIALLLPTKGELHERIGMLQRRLQRRTAHTLSELALAQQRLAGRLKDPQTLLLLSRSRLDQWRRQAQEGWQRALRSRETGLEGFKARLRAASPATALHRRALHRQQLQSRLDRAAAACIAEPRQNLSRLERRLEQGWRTHQPLLLALDETGAVIDAAARLREGQALTLRFADGRVGVRVEEIERR